MTDLNTIKTDAQQASQGALKAINREASWISRHPGITAWGIIALVVALIAVGIKAFA